MEQSNYKLGEAVPDTPRFEGDTIECGTRYQVLRDGVQVASIYEHPTNYKGGLASVSMAKIRWAGRQASGYPKNPDGALFFDFVSEHTTAEETLPDVAKRVDRILEWRRAHEGEAR